MRTKAIPLSGGIWEKNCSNASSPPAEAPMPTTKILFLYPQRRAMPALTVQQTAQDWAAFLALFFGQLLRCQDQLIYSFCF